MFGYSHNLGFIVDNIPFFYNWLSTYIQYNKILMLIQVDAALKWVQDYVTLIGWHLHSMINLLIISVWILKRENIIMNTTYNLHDR